MIREKIANDIQVAARVKLSGSFTQDEPGYFERGLDWAGDVYDKAKKLPGQTADFVADNARGVGQWAGETGRAIGDAGSMAAEDASQKAWELRQYADRIRNGLTENLEGAYDSFRGVSDAAPGYLGEVADKASRGFGIGMGGTAGADEREVYDALRKKHRAALMKKILKHRAALMKKILIDPITKSPGRAADMAADVGRTKDQLLTKFYEDGSRNLATATDVADSVASRGQNLADLVKGWGSTVNNTIESANRGRDTARTRQDIAEAERDSAMAEAAQYDAPEQSLEDIKQMLAGGVQRAGEAWNNADPTAKGVGVGVAAAGGLGAAGIMKLLRLVAQAKGKKVGPAPV